MKIDLARFDKLIRFGERMIYPIAVLIAAVGLAYWYWTTTPSYALTAVVVSVKNRDVDMFEKYVDLDSVTSKAFDDIVEGPIASELMGRNNSFIGIGFVKFFKREIVELAHGKVIEWIREGGLKGVGEQIPTTVNPLTTLAVMNSGELVQAANHGKEESLPAPYAGESKNQKLKRVLKEFGISKFGYRGVKYLRIEGPRAELGIEFFSPKLNKKWVAQFLLEDAGGYWRVTQLDNLNEIIQMYSNNRSDDISYAELRYVYGRTAAAALTCL